MNPNIGSGSFSPCTSINDIPHPFIFLTKGFYHSATPHLIALFRAAFCAGSFQNSLPIAKTLGRHRAVFSLTWIDIRDSEEPQSAQYLSEKLVQQVALSTREAHVC